MDTPKINGLQGTAIHPGSFSSTTHLLGMQEQKLAAANDPENLAASPLSQVCPPIDLPTPVMIIAVYKIGP